MITNFERNRFVQETVGSVTSRIMQTYTDKVLFFKVLANAIDKAVPNNKLQFSQMSEGILENDEALEQCYQQLLTYLSEIAVEDQQETEWYSTGDIAKFFGVSIQTIHNWVKEGRFIGIEKDTPNKQLRISGKTLWKAKNGRLHPVSEFVQEWEEEQKRTEQVSMNDGYEFDFLVDQLAKFEHKYGGDFEITLGMKSTEEMTAQEESDASLWKYLKSRVEVCQRV